MFSVSTGKEAARATPCGLELAEARGGFPRHLVEGRMEDAEVDLLQAEWPPVHRLVMRAKTLEAAVECEQVAVDGVLSVILRRRVLCDVAVTGSVGSASTTQQPAKVGTTMRCVAGRRCLLRIRRG